MWFTDCKRGGWAEIQKYDADHKEARKRRCVLLLFTTRVRQREEELGPSRGMFYSRGETSIISPPCVTDSMELFISRFRERHIRRLHVRVAAMRTVCCTEAGAASTSHSSVREVNANVSNLKKLRIDINEFKSKHKWTVCSVFFYFYFQFLSPPPGWWRAWGIHGNLAVCWRRTRGAPCWPEPWTCVVRSPSAGAGTRKSGGHTDWLYMMVESRQVTNTTLNYQLTSDYCSPMALMWEQDAGLYVNSSSIQCKR